MEELVKLVGIDGEEVEGQELNPAEYFEMIKERKQKVTDETLNAYYENILVLLSKARRTGQKNMMKKLMFHIDCIEKERELVKNGIDTFIYKDDITDYIDNVAKGVVKIIELENYPREIPEDIVQTIEKVGHLFDRMYVVFTDYTGKVEKEVEKKRREKDPILFGTFQKNTTNRGSLRGDGVLIERFYFLGDWIDPYCDLTLEKMISEMKSKGKDIEHNIKTPEDLDEIRAELGLLKTAESGNWTTYKYTNSDYSNLSNSSTTITSTRFVEAQTSGQGAKVPEDKGFFAKVKSALKG